MNYFIFIFLEFSTQQRKNFTVPFSDMCLKQQLCSIAILVLHKGLHLILTNSM